MKALFVMLCLGIGLGDGAYGKDFFPANPLQRVLFRCEALPGKTAPTGRLEGFPTGGLPEAFEIVERKSGWFLEIHHRGQVIAKFELAEELEAQGAGFDLFSAKQKNQWRGYVHVYRGENTTIVNFGIIAATPGQISLGNDYIGVSTEDGFDCAPLSVP